MAAILTTQQLCQFLRRRHENTGAADEWVYYEEVATSTGARVESYLDAWAMALWPSAGYMRITYEIKVSRADFAKEVAKPQKRKLGLLYSTHFYFVTPKGLLKTAEVPAECGLLEFDEDGTCYVPVAAPRRDTHPPTWAFFASLMRQSQRLADDRVRARIRREFDGQEVAIQREKQRLDDARTQLRQERDRFYQERMGTNVNHSQR